MSTTTTGRTQAPTGGYSIRKLADSDEAGGQLGQGDFMARIYGLVRSVEFYGQDSQQPLAIARRIAEAVARRIDEGAVAQVSLAATGGASGRTVRTGKREASRSAWLAERLSSHGIEAVALDRDVTPDSLIEFVSVLTSEHDVLQRLLAARLAGIRIFADPRAAVGVLGGPDSESGGRQRALVSYALALSRIRWALGQVRAGHAPPMGPLKRTVLQLAAEMERDADAFLGLLSFRPFPGSGHNHMLNVALLTLAISRTLRIDRMGAVSAAVGAIGASLGQFSRAARAPQTWWQRGYVADDSPGSALDAVREIVRTDVSSPEAARQLVTAYECTAEQRDLVPEGWYPDPRNLSEPARVVQIAAAYDHLMDSGYSGMQVPPHVAVQMVLANAPGHFSGMPLRGFVRTVGFYPPGVLVRLSNGMGGVVVARPDPDAAPNRPWLRLIGQPGLPLANLNSPEAAGVGIDDAVDPQTAGVNPLRFFLLGAA